MTQKKNIDNTGMSKKGKSLLNNSPTYKKGKTGAGIGISKIAEPIPEFAKAEAEKIYSQGNSAIVLGRDRPGSKLSGYGGRGDTGASSVDIVVGRMGAAATEVTDKEKPVFADPNFKVDSARIYISQKTDIDKNFGIIEGRIGPSLSKSAIGIKADAVRIVAREGIKLVTKTDLKNSQGAEVSSVLGVDIIAGNDDENLHPMVLGDNLEKALNKMVSHLHKLTAA